MWNYLSFLFVVISYLNEGRQKQCSM